MTKQKQKNETLPSFLFAKRKRRIYVSAPLSLFPMKKKRVVVGDKKREKNGFGKKKERSYLK